MEPIAENSPWRARWRLPLALLAISFAIHLWLIATTQVTSRDSLGFARAARQFDDPNADRPAGSNRTRLDVLREAEHPPGYPAAVWLMSFPVRAVYHASPAEQFIRSAQVVSLVASLLLALVQFRLGRELFGPAVGFLAAALFQMLPVAARSTSDGISEGLFLLAVATAMLLGVKAIRDQRPRDYLACGTMTAAAYLVRPEGMLIGLVVGLVLVTLTLTRRLAARPMLVRATALTLGVLLLAAPYMATVGGVTNKPTGRKLLRFLIGAPPQPELVANPSIPLLGAWYVPGEDGSRPVWIAATFVKESTKTLHYLPAILALVGLGYVLRTRWRTEPAIRVPVLYLGAHAGLLLVMATSSGYLSERHTLPLALVGCLLAAQGLVVVAERIAALRSWNPRTVARFATAILVLACLPPLARTRHDDRFGHILAGRWLAEHAAQADAIVDPFDWAQFYAGRTLYGIPADPNPATSFYAVVEEGKGAPRSKLPRHGYAVELARKGRPVYEWQGESHRGMKVVIYQVLPGEQ